MSESDVVIRMEGLSKKYFLHHEQSEQTIRAHRFHHCSTCSYVLS